MIVILDNGHGGLYGGKSLTPGRRSPLSFGKPVLYEGAFNRWVVNRICEILDKRSIPYHLTSPETDDTPLGLRVKRANAFNTYHKNKTYFISIHANAAKRINTGTGVEAFYYKGSHFGKILAVNFLSSFSDKIPYMRVRHRSSNKDMAKVASFKVLRSTKMPAILIECGFMDNERDRKLLLSERYISHLSILLADMITDIYNRKHI